MRLKNMIAVVAGIATAMSLGGLAGSASATPTAQPRTTGSIVLATPTQSMTFDAFATSPVKGSVSYTNWEYSPTLSTGVWRPVVGTFEFDPMYQGGGPYPHILTVDSYTPTSPTSVSFSGHGYYQPNPGWTETFTGTVSGTAFNMRLLPDDGGALYGWTYTNVAGTVQSDGSVSGTWSDSLGRVDAFTTSAGTNVQVFHYVAPVTAASVTSPNANFTYTIPVGSDLAGTSITVYVTDNGTPGTKDSFGYTINPNPTHYNYNIVSGNLTVFAS
jgi:hypothetical protein